MTDRAQFEAMLEALINEDHDSAKEIFHNIVVAKSREIYEELLESDFAPEEETTEGFGGDEEEPADDAEGEEDAEGEDDAEGEEDGEEMPDFGDEEEEGGEDGAIEDRVMDLEDALDDLKAEFEQLLAGEEGEEGADEFGADMMGGDDMGAAGAEFGDEEEAEGAMMFEYKDLIKVPTAKMGDNGVNTKSAVAGKNDMGGTTANIAKSGTETPTFANQGHLKGSSVFKGTPKEDNAGNVNVPGAKGATKLSPVKGGHGAEKAGAKETADNKGSLLKQAKK